MFAVNESGNSQRLGFKVAVAFLASLFVVILGFSQLGIDVSWAGDHHHKHHPKMPSFAPKPPRRVLIACGYEAKDDYSIAVGNCINVSDRQERKECYIEAEEQFKEANEECRDVREARLEICELVGEERYDPDFDPENFQRSPKILTATLTSHSTSATSGYMKAAAKRSRLKYWTATKLIEGVTCRVVNDRVVDEDGKVIEDTDDWYAQHKDTGDVWYCGEIARNYELFEGDDPEEPELVDIDGSWKTGRDGAKPGILIEADPQPGHAYRQELLLGDAEDVAEVLS